MIPRLTSAYLTDRLKENGLLTTGSITAVIPGEMTDGFIRFEAICSPDTPTNVPRKYLIKTNQDGYPFGAVESGFYTDIAAHLPNLAPLTLDVGLDEETGHCYFLQADLEDTHTFAVTDKREPTIDRLGAVVDQIARVHAYCWDQPFIDDERFRLRRYDICDMAQVGYENDLRDACAEVANQRLPRLYKFAESTLQDKHLGVCQAAVLAWPDLIESRYEGPNLTLIHADLHPWNVFVPQDESGSPLIFDWELLCRGIGVFDVLYLILRCRLPPKVRQEYESELIPRYHATLSRSGVTGYSLEACQADYRLSIIPNILPPVAWGRPLNLVTTMEAFQDWECASLV